MAMYVEGGAPAPVRSSSECSLAVIAFFGSGLTTSAFPETTVVYYKINLKYSLFLSVHKV